MRMAIAAGASTYLVADIDRGGVFGSVYGTIALLRPEERVLMKGVIINKFRGDASLFEEGRSLLKELTGIPVVGVIPWFRDIKIEEEDSVALDMKNNTYKDGKINVAIILLKRMSNFTDFDVLEMDPRFNPYYTNNIDEIEKADIILLPGSKNTLSDLQSLRANGIAMAIIRAHKAGKNGDRYLRWLSNDGSPLGRSGKYRGKYPGDSRSRSSASMHSHRAGEDHETKRLCFPPLLGE
mgnify:CR=1 FL=1